MNSSARSVAVTALAVAVILAWAVIPLAAYAAPPQDDPLAPLVPLEPLPPLKPPASDSKIPVYLEVGPDDLNVCYPDNKNIVVWVRMTPPGMTLQQAVDKEYAEGVSGTWVNIKDNGNLAYRARTTANGFVDWNWAPKKLGKHKLEFSVERPGKRYHDAEPVIREVEVKKCKKKVSVNYKESCIVPQNAIVNQFNVKIEGTVESDEDGKIAPTELAASYDLDAHSGIPECQYSYSGTSGSFTLQAGGEMTEGGIDLELSGGPVVVSGVTGTAVCEGHSKTFPMPPKTMDVVNQLQLAQLSFPEDGGSRAYSLSGLMFLVGTGTAYADVTVSVEPEDEQQAGS